jgi:ribosomal protein S30
VLNVPQSGTLYEMAQRFAQKGENSMSSKTQKAKAKRKWKDKPNKKNLKEQEKRIERNAEILKELAAKDAK